MKVHPRTRYEIVKTACVASGILMLVAVAACSSLFHFSSPEAQAVSCDVTSAALPDVEAAAALCGPFAAECAALLSSVFGYACADAAVKGASQADATAAGLKAVQAKRVELVALKAKSP